MILLVCRVGSENIGGGEYSLASIAQHSFDFKPKEYRYTYNAFSKTPPPPQVQLNEDVFITSRDVIFDETLGEEIIGDFRSDKKFFADAGALFDHISPRFPDYYSGNIYINACLESGRSTNGFANEFFALMKEKFYEVKVHGRQSGTIIVQLDGNPYPIIPPSSCY